MPDMQPASPSQIGGLLSFAQSNYSGPWSDFAVDVIGAVQAAMDEWRVHNDPASDHGLTMAEHITLRLAQGGWLR